jgi:hypothetical protein
MVWLETITNPTMQVIDIDSISKMVHEFNEDILVVADNTFLSPCLQVSVYSLRVYRYQFTLFVFTGISLLSPCLQVSVYSLCVYRYQFTLYVFTGISLKYFRGGMLHFIF